MANITDKQLEAMKLITEGYNVDQVADKMGITRSCAEKHLKSVRERTETKTLAQAVYKLAKLGILCAVLVNVHNVDAIRCTRSGRLREKVTHSDWK